MVNFSGRHKNGKYWTQITYRSDTSGQSPLCILDGRRNDGAIFSVREPFDAPLSVQEVFDTLCKKLNEFLEVTA
jgi:hypothetical protein